MTELANAQAQIRELLIGLPLEDIALRRFYEGFQFRCGVPSTNEGSPSANEMYALRSALCRAFVCGFISKGDLGHSSDERVPESVEQSFLDRLVSAFDLAKEEVPFSIFISYFDEVHPDMTLHEALRESLLAYAFRSRNGLDFH